MTWTEPVRTLLQPLEDYTRLHAATLRRFGARTIDLSFPNPRLLCDPRPYQALAELAAQASPLDLRYSPFGGFTSVRRRVAAALAARHHLPYAWRDIIMTPGASAALTVILRSLFTPPQRLMVITPCWLDYPLYLADRGLGCDMVPAAADKHLDLDAIERAWTPATSALIISQPVSPTGVVYDSRELQALGDLMSRMSARHRRTSTLIADEAHRDQKWADTPCPSPACHYPDTITVYSFGKAWRMQGQRTGYIAVSPRLERGPETRLLLEQGMRLSGHSAPTALMQHLAAILCDTPPQHTGLAALQRHARHELSRNGIDIVPGDATPFLYARCPTGDDQAFVTALAERGVLTMPSALFHEEGWFRLSLNMPQPELSRAARIIAEVAVHD
jgi:aspartate aminotransferase